MHNQQQTEKAKKSVQFIEFGGLPESEGDPGVRQYDGSFGLPAFTLDTFGYRHGVYGDEQAQIFIVLECKLNVLCG